MTQVSEEEIPTSSSACMRLQALLAMASSQSTTGAQAWSLLRLFDTQPCQIPASQEAFSFGPVAVLVGCRLVLFFLLPFLLLFFFLLHHLFLYHIFIVSSSVSSTTFPPLLSSHLSKVLKSRKLNLLSWNQTWAVSWTWCNKSWCTTHKPLNSCKGTSCPESLLWPSEPTLCGQLEFDTVPWPPATHTHTFQ